MSSIILDEEEMTLLNKGLKHALPPTTVLVEDLCVDVMSSIRYKPNEIKENIENKTLQIIQETVAEHTSNERDIRMQHIVKSLRKKKLIISKADKSNNVVVMDVEYYERVMSKVLRDGPYAEMENDPLYNMIDDVNDVLEKHKFGHQKRTEDMESYESKCRVPSWFDKITQRPRQ